MKKIDRDAFNMAEYAIRVLEKNGYIREGLLHNYPFGREFHNVVMLAILK